MDQLTREELDFLYTKPKRDGWNLKSKRCIWTRIVEFMVFIAFFLFLWDKVFRA
ncbi:hypothetical protein [Thermotalea metallivorans]|uniref:hypothetical protein n=1 Tax=Thermotalea metallivorans TaxID=520762 RepID=UPI0012ED163E|nr:hypothetical protein [Thermotalea metallivorans]